MSCFCGHTLSCCHVDGLSRQILPLSTWGLLESIRTPWYNRKFNGWFSCGSWLNQLIIDPLIKSASETTTTKIAFFWNIRLHSTFNFIHADWLLNQCIDVKPCVFNLKNWMPIKWLYLSLFQSMIFFVNSFVPSDFINNRRLFISSFFPTFI